MSAKLAMLMQLLNKPNGGATTEIMLEAAEDIPPLANIGIDKDGKARPVVKQPANQHIEDDWRTVVTSQGLSYSQLTGNVAHTQTWLPLADNHYIRIFGPNGATTGSYADVVQINPTTGQCTTISSLLLPADHTEATGLVPKSMRILKLTQGAYVVSQYCNAPTGEWLSLTRINFDDVTTFDIASAVVERKAIYMGGSGPYDAYTHQPYVLDSDHWGIVTDYNGTHFYVYTFKTAYDVGDPWHDYGSYTGTGMPEQLAYSLSPWNVVVLSNGVVVNWSINTNVLQWKHDTVNKTVEVAPVTSRPSNGGNDLVDKAHGIVPRIMYDDGVGGLHTLCALNGSMATSTMYYPSEPMAFLDPGQELWDGGSTHKDYFFDTNDGGSITQVSEQKWIYVNNATGAKAEDVNSGLHLKAVVYEIEFTEGRFVATEIGLFNASTRAGYPVEYVLNDTIDIFYSSYAEILGDLATSVVSECLIGINGMLKHRYGVRPVKGWAAEEILSGNVGRCVVESLDVLDYGAGSAGQQIEHHVVTNGGKAIRLKAI